MAVADSQQEKRTGATAGAATSHRRTVWLGAAILLVLAAAMRFVGLGNLDPWLDEIHSFEDSGELSSKLMMWQLTGTTHSPLPYLEIKVVRTLVSKTLGPRAGRSAFALRLPAALYGTAAVLLLYVLVGKALGWGVAFWAGVLLAINPFALEWAREARMYSHWLVYALLLSIVAYGAVRACRERQAGALDWRWWLLGVLSGLAFVTSVAALTTVLAVLAWVMIVGLVDLARRRRRGAGIVLGAGVSTGVFLLSWALPGLVKLVTIPRGDPSGAAPPAFMDSLLATLSASAGEVSPAVGVMLWLLALAGLVVACGAPRRGSAEEVKSLARWECVLLIAMASLTPWLSFPAIASRHFFAPRFVFVSVIALSVGWGVLLVKVWGLRVKARPARAAVAIVAVIALGLAWFPTWSGLYTQPKMHVRQMLAPVIEHARPGDALVMIPDWFVTLGSFYDFGKACVLVRPPAGARYAIIQTTRTGGAGLGPFDEDFDRYIADDARRPAATWVILVSPLARQSGHPSTPLEESAPIFQAYKLDPQAHLPSLEQLAKDAQTLTFRVTATGVDQAAATHNR